MKIIELSGVVGLDITAKGLKNRLPKNGEDVVIKVDSVGGSVFEGNRLYNTILDYKGKIEIHLGALAASAASYFPLSAGKENIKVRHNTVFMGHKAWSLAIGNSDDLLRESDILKGMDKIIAKAYNKTTAEPIEDILEAMKNEFWLMSGQEIVDAGYASAVIDEDEETEDEAETLEKTEIQARILEAQNLLKQENIKEDHEKWAAKIGEINNEIAPRTGQNKEKEDFEVMKLNEILEKNPEAKAEFEGIKAEFEKGAKAAVDKDRERFAKVLKLSGVNLAEDILTNAKSMTVEEFAIAELEQRNEATAEKEKIDAGKLKKDNQLPKKEPEAKATETKLDNELDSFYGKEGDK